MGRVSTEALAVWNRFAMNPVPTVKSIANFLWINYLSWPAPLWRLRGYANVSLGGRSCRIYARGIEAPIGLCRWISLDRWESDLARLFPLILPHCRSAFDVGAWIGPYTILFAKMVREGGQVVAFEPDPVARHQLRANKLLNNLSNVSILPYAVSDSKGVATLGSASFGRSGSHLGEREADSMALDVETVCLDDFCAENDLWPDLLKIDVEGAEDRVISGASSALSKAKCVVVEFHPHAFSEPGLEARRIRHAFEEANLKVLNVRSDRNVASSQAVYHLVGAKPSLYSEIRELLATEEWTRLEDDRDSTFSHG